MRLPHSHFRSHFCSHSWPKVWPILQHLGTLGPWVTSLRILGDSWAGLFPFGSGRRTATRMVVQRQHQELWRERPEIESHQLELELKALVEGDLRHSSWAQKHSHLETLHLELQWIAPASRSALSVAATSDFDIFDDCREEVGLNIVSWWQWCWCLCATCLYYLYLINTDAVIIYIIILHIQVWLKTRCSFMFNLSIRSSFPCFH